MENLEQVELAEIVSAIDCLQGRINALLIERDNKIRVLAAKKLSQHEIAVSARISRQRVSQIVSG